MILKLLALGPVFYIQSKWNLFDGVIVIVSVIDTLMEFTNVSDNKSGTSVFRTFRLVRNFFEQFRGSNRTKNRQYQILTVKPLQPYTHTSHFTTMPCKLNAKINTKKSIYCWKTHPCTNNKVHNLKV